MQVRKAVLVAAFLSFRGALPLLLVYCAISAALSYWQFSFDRSVLMSGADVAFGMANEAAGVVLIELGSPAG